MKPKRTQLDRVLSYLRDPDYALTRYSALEDLGIANLTAVISTLRKRGHTIETVMNDGINRWGEPCRYAKYVLIETEEE